LIEGDSFLYSSSVKTPGPGEYIFCDSVLPSHGVSVVVRTQLRTTCGDNSLTCRRSNDLEPVSCRLRRPRRPACSSLQVMTGHGTWTIRTVSAGPTSCVGFVYLLTSDKMWRRRMYVCRRSRQHQFIHGPSKLMGHICKPGKVYVSVVSPGRMVEIALHGVFPWPDVHPRRHALSGQPPLRAQMSRARRAAGRYEIALRLRSSGCRCRAGLLARRA